MQSMTSLMPFHALHAPQHAAASPFGPLNQKYDFFRPSYRSRLYIAGKGKSRYVGFCLELPSPRWTADQGLRAPSDLDIGYCYTDSVNSYTEAVTRVSYVALIYFLYLNQGSDIKFTYAFKPEHA